MFLGEYIISTSQYADKEFRCALQLQALAVQIGESRPAPSSY